MGLFWQLGHDHGMEFDINARTKPTDILPVASRYAVISTRTCGRTPSVVSDRQQLAHQSDIRLNDSKDEAVRHSTNNCTNALELRPFRFFFPMSNHGTRKTVM